MNQKRRDDSKPNTKTKPLHHLFVILSQLFQKFIIYLIILPVEWHLLRFIHLWLTTLQTKHLTIS